MGSGERSLIGRCEPIGALLAICLDRTQLFMVILAVEGESNVEARGSLPSVESLNGQLVRGYRITPWARMVSSFPHLEHFEFLILNGGVPRPALICSAKC